jgi:hypothetical protein
MLRHACGFKLANGGHDTRSLQNVLAFDMRVRRWGGHSCPKWLGSGVEKPGSSAFRRQGIPLRFPVSQVLAFRSLLAALRWFTENG